jgi:NitT/TauT family transport system substrate-binding protein
VRYVTWDSLEPEIADDPDWIGRGVIDFDWGFPTSHILAIEAGSPITVVAGIHSGCLELIANDSVQSVAELKGKRVATDRYMTSRAWLLLMAAYVGLDIERDIEWVESDDSTSTMELFAQGKADAFLAASSEPQQLRARKIPGHTILNSSLDEPWSQYFCCMLCGARDYVANHPVATKRVLRALFKAADLCASDPERVAQTLVDIQTTEQYDVALQMLKEIRYDTWRVHDPEDTLRFYALRMREAGLIKSDPKTVLAHTDWRFLDELKQELKG